MKLARERTPRVHALVDSNRLKPDQRRPLRFFETPSAPATPTAFDSVTCGRNSACQVVVDQERI